MKTLPGFKASLNSALPPKDISLPLKSLWYDLKDNWNQAHSQVDQQSDLDSAWVHAYLHRKEGDIGNADYWYRKAGKTRPNLSLEEEQGQLILNFINQS